MAGPFYVDPSRANNGDGSSWDAASGAGQPGAFNTIVSALAVAVANEIIYCRGTQTSSATIATVAAGSITTGWVKIIGCNASGNNDGTKFTINFGAGAYSVSVGHSLIWWENIRITSGTSNGFTGNGTINGNVFNNCQVDNVSGSGWETGFSTGCLWVRCLAYLCGTGFATYTGGHYLFCTASDNTGAGFSCLSWLGVMLGCLIYDNGAEGINTMTGTIIHSTIDGNTTKGIEADAVTNVPPYVIGCRITNHSGAGDIGIDANSETIGVGWSYMENNADANIQNDTYLGVINVNGVTTNEEDQSDPDKGYTSLTEGSEDFNLNSDATLRRTAITIPTS